MIEMSYARRSTRRPVEVCCEVIRAAWDAPVAHEVRDLSAFGAWIRTSFPAPIGEDLVVSFTPPGWAFERALTLFARVVRVVRSDADRRGGMGLAFIDMDGVERRALQRCLRRLAA
jgi:hypothetical protein